MELEVPGAKNCGSGAPDLQNDRRMPSGDTAARHAALLWVAPVRLPA